MDNDMQRASSAENIRNAIIDCIGVLRAEQKKNYGGAWDDYIEDAVDNLMDAIGDISGSLMRGVDLPVDAYERLTGHEMGVCMGRV